MRIDTVHADAFGPFRRAELELAPGLTVVHGPNEAGKSSWYAALYAGLCGRRRLRGRGTVEQKRFRDRHQPWSGRGWSVGVTVALEDGRRLRFSRNLVSGDTTVTDADTGARVEVGDLEHEGSVDGSRLVGLNRDSAQATVFVGQADVLRVLEDADGLQDLLQRAAATTTVDTTVDQALERVDEQRRLQVGHPHLGQRPLRAAVLALEQARQEADDARDAYDVLQQVLVQRRRAREELAQAEGALERLAAAARWVEVERRRQRLERVRALQEEAATLGADPPADAVLVRSVIEALGAVQERGEQPPAPAGATVEALRAELSALPEAPVGDTAVDPVLEAAHERAVQAAAALAAHRDAPPEEPEGPQDGDAEALRALAAVLDAAPQTVDVGLVAQADDLRRRREQAHADHVEAVQEHARRADAARAVQQVYDEELARYEDELAAHERRMAEYRRALEAAAAEQARRAVVPAQTVRRRSPLLLAAGGLLLALAAVLVVLGQAPAAAAVGVVGLVLLGVGLRGREEQVVAPTVPEAPAPVPPPPTAPVRPVPPVVPDVGPPPAAPAPDLALERVEAELAVQRAAAARSAKEREAAVAQAAALGLPAEPAQLRARAVALETGAERARAAAQWHSREQALRQAAEQAQAQLLDLLAPRLPAGPDPRTDPEAAWTRYVQDCRRRAGQQADAARRADLEEALRLREQADARHAEVEAAHRSAEERLAGLQTQLLGEVLPPADAVVRLGAWLQDQERRRERAGRRAEVLGALEQALGGGTPEELSAEVDAAAAAAGPRPEELPVDVEAALGRAQADRDVAAARWADLTGRAAALRERLVPVAEAVEAEAAAERRLEAVSRLGELLAVVEEALRSAKEQVNADVAPALASRLRPWVPRVTLGRYSDVAIDPETLAVHVREPQGAMRAATVLSHGTTEQVYLLLRLAVGDLLSTNDEPTPVVLDDVTVQCDRQRTVALLGLLHEVSAHRQVVLFSQEEEVRDWAEVTLTGPRDRLVALPELVTGQAAVGG